MAGLLALAIAMGIGRFAFTPILPMMQADAGLSLAAGSWLASANYVGYFLGAVAALMVRHAPASMIRLGLALVGVTTMAMAMTDALSLWIVLRFAAGVASAWVLVFVSSRGDGRPEVVFSGVGAGIAGAGLVCLLLVATSARSDVAWTLLGALALAGSALVWHRFRKPASTTAYAAVMPFRWTPEALRLTLAYCAFGFGYIIPATFLPAMAREFLPDPVHFGLSWPVFGAAAAASTWFAGPLRKRFGDRKLWIGGHLAMASGIALLAVEPIPALWRTLLCALLVGGTFVLVTMVALQEGRRLAKPESVPAFIAAMTCAFAIGQIAGPVVVALSRDFLLSLLLAAGALSMGALLLRR